VSSKSPLLKANYLKADERQNPRGVYMEKLLQDVMSISKKVGSADCISVAARKAWPQIEDPV
jgi:hypothetical protein